MKVDSKPNKRSHEGAVKQFCSPAAGEREAFLRHWIRMAGTEGNGERQRVSGRNVSLHLSLSTSAPSSSKTCALRYTYTVKYRGKIDISVVYYKKLL